MSNSTAKKVDLNDIWIEEQEQLKLIDDDNEIYDIDTELSVVDASFHLDGDFGVTNKVKQALIDASNSFIYIGFLLDEANNLNYYMEKGFSSIYEYCEAEFDFKRSSTNNFIRVYRCFGESMHLKPQYKDYNYSQLVEMCSLTDEQLKIVKPDMKIKEIRDLKKNIISVVSVPALQSVQTSGQIESTEETSVTENFDKIKNSVYSEDFISEKSTITVYDNNLNYQLPVWLSSKMAYLFLDFRPEYIFKIIDVCISNLSGIPTGYFNTNIDDNLFALGLLSEEDLDNPYFKC